MFPWILSPLRPGIGDDGSPCAMRGSSIKTEESPVRTLTIQTTPPRVSAARTWVVLNVVIPFINCASSRVAARLTWAPKAEVGSGKAMRKRRTEPGGEGSSLVYVMFATAT